MLHICYPNLLKAGIHIVFSEIKKETLLFSLNISRKVRNKSKKSLFFKHICGCRQQAESSYHISFSYHIITGCCCCIEYYLWKTLGKTRCQGLLLGSSFRPVCMLI
ncbi:hypothetical protein FQA47_007208 [Oryzias melastigma]|uniref:Uncharacterized protein n=1 Tax=Oryzias melastigma TaxID=30732 RepID=A0A834BQY4_ORYME|nr:hypothetical protein FQA47_007208 [Oryzias melastigma]